MRFLTGFLCSVFCICAASVQAFDRSKMADFSGWEELVHSEIASVVSNKSVRYDQVHNGAASQDFSVPPAAQLFSIGAYNQNSGDNANVSSSISVMINGMDIVYSGYGRN